MVRIRYDSVYAIWCVERERASCPKLPYIDRHLNSVDLTVPAEVTSGLNQTKTKWPPLPVVLGSSSKGHHFRFIVHFILYGRSNFKFVSSLSIPLLYLLTAFPLVLIYSFRFSSVLSWLPFLHQLSCPIFCCSLHFSDYLTWLLFSYSFLHIHMPPLDSLCVSPDPSILCRSLLSSSLPTPLASSFP